ncbi:hypothetical protein PUN28_013455 [Cardiocondyla obscurior]|uniref:Transmembrane protein n=1 Tax=Cardiocondyla obscurior TaxID=286306 RepID=A0AAW2F6J7_9HYME
MHPVIDIETRLSLHIHIRTYVYIHILPILLLVISPLSTLVSVSVSLIIGKELRKSSRPLLTERASRIFLCAINAFLILYLLYLKEKKKKKKRKETNYRVAVTFDDYVLTRKTGKYKSLSCFGWVEKSVVKIDARLPCKLHIGVQLSCVAVTRIPSDNHILLLK